MKCDLQKENTPLLWPFSYSSLSIKINPSDSRGRSGVVTFNGHNCQQVLMLVLQIRKKTQRLFSQEETNKVTLNVCACVWVDRAGVKEEFKKQQRPQLSAIDSDSDAQTVKTSCPATKVRLK